MNKVYKELEECISDAFAKASHYAVEGVENAVGGPFGAAMIHKIGNTYSIIAIERNTVLKDKDPTCHAEVNVIKKACKKLNRFELEDCILVTTGKSCPMCISAACWAKIKVVYFGAEYKYAVQCGFKDEEIFNYIRGNSNIIKEIYVDNDNAKEPFDKWLKLQEKTVY